MCSLLPLILSRQSIDVVELAVESEFSSFSALAGLLTTCEMLRAIFDSRFKFFDDTDRYLDLMKGTLGISEPGG